LLGALRDLLLVRVLPDRADLLSRAPDEAAQLVEAAAPLSREDLTRAFQLLADLEFGLKGSAQPQFLFEAALIRLADLGAVRPIEEFLTTLRATGVSSGPTAAVVATSPQKKSLPTPELRADSSRPARTGRSHASDEIPLALPNPTPPPAAPFIPSQRDATAPVSAEVAPVVRLFDFRARLHEVRPMTDALLDAAAVAWNGDEIRIAFPPESAAVGRQMARKESIDLLESVAAEVAGRRVRVVVAAGASKTPTPSPTTAPNRRTAAPEPPPRAVEPPDTRVARESADPDREQLLKEATQEPGIAKLLKEFGANVVEIRSLTTPPIVESLGTTEAPEEAG